MYQNRNFKVKTFQINPGLLLFIPGAFVLALGALLILAPGLMRIVLAGAFIGFGAMILLAAWKVIQFKKKVNSMVRDLEGKIIIHSQNQSPSSLKQVEIEEDGEIVIH